MPVLFPAAVTAAINVEPGRISFDIPALCRLDLNRIDHPVAGATRTGAVFAPAGFGNVRPPGNFGYSGLQSADEDFVAKAVLLIPYFGPLPRWFDVFLLTCGRNPDYRFVLYSDQDVPDLNGCRNVEWRRTTLDELSARAAVATRLPLPVLTSAYKLCDFKPAFGEIFAEDIRGVHFWGHADIDVIWGRLDHFLLPLMDENDLISGEARRICGPFTLYRNLPRINSLYREVPGMREIFMDVSEGHAFDEVVFSDHVKALARVGKVRMSSIDGGHGHSESRARYEYRDGRVFREWTAKEALRHTMRSALLPITPPLWHDRLPVSRERMFFHFRTWKSGMEFDFDLAAARGWKLRPDRLVSIPS